MKAALTLWASAVVLQWLLFPETGAASAAGLTLLGGLLGLLLCLRRDVLLENPVSSAMVLGYTLSHFLLPPVATLLEGKSLVNNLQHPELVFPNLLYGLCALGLAHVVYRNFPPLQALRFFLSEKLYRPVGFFQMPSNLHLLCMGLVGQLALGFNVFFGGSGDAEPAGVFGKVMQAMAVFAFIPYCSLVRPALGDHTPLDGRWRRTLVLYSMIMLGIAASLNARSAILFGFASVGLVFTYCYVTGLVQTQLFNLRNLALGAVALWLLAGPIANFATAMVMVRSDRGSASGMEMLVKTLDVMGDPQAIRDFKKEEVNTRSALWDEYYVDNVLLSRLCNLKFADQTLGLAEELGPDGRAYLREIEFLRAVSMLPSPLIEGLGLTIDKKYANSGSGGDHLLFAVTGAPYVIGGFRTGSLLGNSAAALGFIYPLVLAFMALLIFTVMDAQTSRVADSTRIEGWRPVLSPYVVVAFFTLTFHFTSAATGAESLSAAAGPILRGWAQTAFVYAVTFWLTHAIAQALSSGHEPVRA